jgi:hypothetical protein
MGPAHIPGIGAKEVGAYEMARMAGKMGYDIVTDQDAIP